MWFSLEWAITLAYERCEDRDGARAATLTYWEKPDQYTPNAAEPVGVFTDAYKLTGGDAAPQTTADIFKDWRNRDFMIPQKRAKLRAGDTKVVKFTDLPARHLDDAGAWSELTIYLEVYNSEAYRQRFPSAKGMYTKWYGIFHYKTSGTNREIKGKLLNHNDRLP